MKTQTQFKNASLVSVVNGSIVVKDSTGREHTFTNASVVSVNNGTIIVESEWIPKKGELVKITGTCIDAYSIIDKITYDQIFVFGWKRIRSTEYNLKSDYWNKNSQTNIYPVTPEEQKEFDDFCKSQGKIWNKEKLQWEKYRWEPKVGEMYYYVDTLGEISCTTNNTLKLDPHRIKYGNCFQTKEQAQETSKKLKEFLKSL